MVLLDDDLAEKFLDELPNDERSKYVDQDILRAVMHFSDAHADVPDRREVISYGLEQVRKAMSLAESPIELRMAPYLVFQHYAPIGFGPVDVILPNEDIPKERGVYLAPQFWIGRRRLDFAFLSVYPLHNRIFAFECDGKQFHTRSDNVHRDGELAAEQVLTIRAWGYEINADPEAVAKRVSAFVGRMGSLA